MNSLLFPMLINCLGPLNWTNFHSNQAVSEIWHWKAIFIFILNFCLLILYALMTVTESRNPKIAWLFYQANIKDLQCVQQLRDSLRGQVLKFDIYLCFESWIGTPINLQHSSNEFKRNPDKAISFTERSRAQLLRTTHQERLDSCS